MRLALTKRFKTTFNFNRSHNSRSKHPLNQHSFHFSKKENTKWHSFTRSCICSCIFKVRWRVYITKVETSKENVLKIVELNDWFDRWRVYILNKIKFSYQDILIFGSVADSFPWISSKILLYFQIIVKISTCMFSNKFLDRFSCNKLDRLFIYELENL